MILRPDEYGHQNSNNAFVDSLNVRGGRRVVSNLSELYLLYNLQDKLKDNVTIVRVLSEDIDYILIDKTKANLSEGWKANSIITEEKEVVISNTTPTDPKNKLWISGLPGQISLPMTIDWPNISNKPNWINYMPTTSLNGSEGKILSVKSDATGYEYITMSSKTNILNIQLPLSDILSSGTITNIS